VITTGVTRRAHSLLLDDFFMNRPSISTRSQPTWATAYCEPRKLSRVWLGSENSSPSLTQCYSQLVAFPTSNRAFTPPISAHPSSAGLVCRPPPLATVSRARRACGSIDRRVLLRVFGRSLLLPLRLVLPGNFEADITPFLLSLQTSDGNIQGSTVTRAVRGQMAEDTGRHNCSTKLGRIADWRAQRPFRGLATLALTSIFTAARVRNTAHTQDGSPRGPAER